MEMPCETLWIWCRSEGDNFSTRLDRTGKDSVSTCPAEPDSCRFRPDDALGSGAKPRILACRTSRTRSIRDRGYVGRWHTGIGSDRRWSMIGQMLGFVSVWTSQTKWRLRTTWIWHTNGPNVSSRRAAARQDIYSPAELTRADHAWQHARRHS